MTREEATRLLTAPHRDAPAAGVPTGALGLDAALRTRGWPRGRVSQVWGDAATGKTTLLLHSIASAQREFMSCALVDLGNSFDPGYASAVGVDLDDLLVIRPGLDSLGFPGLPVDFLVLDNVSTAHQVQTIPDGPTVLVASQIRAAIGQPGSWTPLAQEAAVGVRLRKTRWNPGGLEVTATVTRDDYGPAPGRSTSWWLRYGHGIDHGRELLALGTRAGVITRNGNFYRLGGMLLGNGSQSAAETLWRSPILASRAENAVRDVMETIL